MFSRTQCHQQNPLNPKPQSALCFLVPVDTWLSLEASLFPSECSVAQSCMTLCNPMDCSLPGSSILRILQARIPECVAMPSSRGSSQPRDQTQVSCVSCIGRRFFTTSGTWETPAFTEALSNNGCLPSHHPMSHCTYSGDTLHYHFQTIILPASLIPHNVFNYTI